MRQPLSLALMLGLIALGSAGPARAAEYLETFETDRDPTAMLAGTLLIGDDGAWRGELIDGTYRLRNDSKKGAVRYFHLRHGQQGRDVRSLTVSVDVSTRFDGAAAGAGLVYLLDPESKTYYAFLVTRKGYWILRRGAKGFERVAGGSNDAIKTDGVNRLSAQLEQESARLFVNGTRVIGHSLKGATEGNVGIIAVDLGDYRFDNFRFVTK